MSNAPRVHLRLYVAGASHNSQLAVERLRSFCAEHFADAHRLEIVDVIREPKRALDDQVVLTPTLVLLSQTPVRRIVGNLSKPDVLARALGVGG